jgi:hypothetical protein
MDPILSKAQPGFADTRVVVIVGVVPTASSSDVIRGEAPRRRRKR